jgi:hypothetical protein
MSYSHCQRDGKSLKTKYLGLANEKPGTGNPTMSDATRLAKEIKVAIDLKVGNTPANADDFFGGDGDDSSQSSPAAGAAPPAASPAVDPPTAAASVPPVITATTAAANNVTAITNAMNGSKKKLVPTRLSPPWTATPTLPSLCSPPSWSSVSGQKSLSFV